MKNHIEIAKDVAEGMLGIGGIPTDEEFYSEFCSRLQGALGIEENEQIRHEQATREAIDLGGGCSQCGDLSGFECICDDEEDDNLICNYCCRPISLSQDEGNNGHCDACVNRF